MIQRSKQTPTKISSQRKQLVLFETINQTRDLKLESNSADRQSSQTCARSSNLDILVDKLSGTEKKEKEVRQIKRTI